MHEKDLKKIKNKLKLLKIFKNDVLYQDYFSNPKRNFLVYLIELFVKVISTMNVNEMIDVSESIVKRIQDVNKLLRTRCEYICVIIYLQRIARNN